MSVHQKATSIKLKKTHSYVSVHSHFKFAKSIQTKLINKVMFYDNNSAYLSILKHSLSHTPSNSLSISRQMQPGSKTTRLIYQPLGQLVTLTKLKNRNPKYTGLICYTRSSSKFEKKSSEF